MPTNPEHPYDALPSLPPQQDIETKDILRLCIKANKKLAELKGLAETIPNQSIFINMLSLKEAQYSSEIENIITTTDELYIALSTKEQKIDSAIKEVLLYRDALWEGYQELGKRNLLTTNIICKIQAKLIENKAGIRTLPGTALKNAISGKIIYTPPSGENVLREKLKNLEEYIHVENDVDPLIKLAIIHYQFEAIHPFYDGNGRTGRIINVLYLVQPGLLRLPILYLSHYIIQNKNQYYQRLRNVTFENKFEAWVLFMLECVEKSAQETIQQINGIKNLMDKFKSEMKEKCPTIYSKELVDVLFHQPYCKVKFLEDLQIAKRQTASEYLYQLEKIGLLTLKKVGRENLFLNTELLKLFKK